MPRFMSFLAGLLLILSMGMGSLAHAAEGSGCIETRVADASQHVEGDRDQVPADNDKPFPHHHGGCQNHQLGVPSTDALTLYEINSALAFLIDPDAWITPAQVDPALRPPQA